jgi:hypothetical protein
VELKKWNVKVGQLNRMVKHSDEYLSKRKDILDSHKLFIEYLNSDILNKLIQLFDASNPNDKSKKISNYIQEERKYHRLNESNITYVSEVYGEDRNKPSLHLQMKKNNKDILHLSIHLTLSSITPETNAGIVHIKKNLYKPLTRKERKIVEYVDILVKTHTNKPHSLEFFTVDRHLKNMINNSKYINFKINKSIYKNFEEFEPEIQQEINVILTILNRLFDENNPEYYIGNENILYPIHNKTNIILGQMNNQIQHATRKNKGVQMGPTLTNISMGQINIIRRIPSTLKTKKPYKNRQVILTSPTISLIYPSAMNKSPKTTSQTQSSTRKISKKPSKDQ